VSFDAQTVHLVALEEACLTVREYAGGPGSKAVIAMLQALDQTYLDQLVHAKPEAVTGLQRSIQQSRAIQAVLAADPSNGRI
jgi:hypothetical protein